MGSWEAEPRPPVLHRSWEARPQTEGYLGSPEAMSSVSVNPCFLAQKSPLLCCDHREPVKCCLVCLCQYSLISIH